MTDERGERRQTEGTAVGVGRVRGKAEKEVKKKGVTGGRR